MISRTDFRGSPHVGIFCIANDDVALAPLSAPESFLSVIKETLGVDVVQTSIANTGLLGIFCVINNKRAIATGLIDKDERKTLEDHFSDIIVVEDSFTAVGNLVSMNDRATVCSRGLEASIKDAIPVRVADSDLVGSALYVNNNGFLAHRDTPESEIRELERVFGVKGDVGTVNFGDPFVSSGIMGNKNGIVVGSFSSGPEMNRIDEIFILNR